MQLFYAPDITMDAILPEEEGRHCATILRHSTGDIVEVTDGNGSFYRCIITSIRKSRVEVAVQETRQEAEAPYRLHVAVAPTKSSDRTDWMIEKAVETGIHKITFIDTEHGERTRVNRERCIRVAVAAMKQSVKARLPVIEDVTSFDVLCRHASPGLKLVAHCYADIPRKGLSQITPGEGEEVLCCIGPEGDFSRAEVKMAMDAGFESVHLGASRLRTETAALAFCYYFYLNASR